MGMTIAEKIIAAAAGVDSVKPGDIHTVTLQIRRNWYSLWIIMCRQTVRRQRHLRRR